MADQLQTPPGTAFRTPAKMRATAELIEDNPHLRDRLKEINKKSLRPLRAQIQFQPDPRAKEALMMFAVEEIQEICKANGIPTDIMTDPSTVPDTDPARNPMDQDQQPMAPAPEPVETIQARILREYELVQGDGSSEASPVYMGDTEFFGTASLRIKKFRLPITDEYTVNVDEKDGKISMKRLHEDFQTNLRNMRKEVRCPPHNQNKVAALHPQVCKVLADIMFDIFGASGLNNMQTAVTQSMSLSGKAYHGLLPVAADKSKELAKDQRASTVERNFWNSLATMIHSKQKKDSYYYFQQTIAAYDVFTNFNKLVESYDSTNPQHRRRMIQVSVDPDGRKDSVIKNYIAKKLHTEKSRFTNEQRQNAAINGLVRAFGLGIVPLVHSASHRKLRRVPTPFYEEIFVQFKMVFPVPTNALRLIKNHIVEPLRIGSLEVFDRLVFLDTQIGVREEGDCFNTRVHNAIQALPPRV